MIDSLDYGEKKAQQTVLLMAFFAGGKISPEGMDAFFEAVVKAYPAR